MALPFFVITPPFCWRPGFPRRGRRATGSPATARFHFRSIPRSAPPATRRSAHRGRFFVHLQSKTTDKIIRRAAVGFGFSRARVDDQRVAFALMNSRLQIAGDLYAALQDRWPDAAAGSQARLIAEQLINDRQIEPAARPVAPASVGSHGDPDNRAFAHAPLDNCRNIAAKSGDHLRVGSRNNACASRERQPRQIAELRIAKSGKNRMLDVPRFQPKRQIGRVRRSVDCTWQSIQRPRETQSISTVTFSPPKTSNPPPRSTNCLS